jgi:SH3/ankyrin repeat-containing protein
MTAVTNGNIEKVVKILINCDPNFVDESNGETPLSIAATSQSATTSAVQRVIVALVNGGALLDFRTKDGRTALHCAVQKSNYVALKTLLDLGLNFKLNYFLKAVNSANYV